MVHIFFQSMLVALSGAMMPGSLLTHTINKSMKSGPKTGLLISIGHALLELIIVLLLLLGTGSFLGSQTAQIMIGFIGGLILNYLGFGMIRDAHNNKISLNLDAKEDKENRNLIMGGFIISASNPYFIFWWAIIGLGFLLSAYASFGIIGVLIFYIGHILSDIGWYSFISIMISRMRRFINQKAYRIIIAVLGVFLIGFGISFLANSIDGIISL